MCEHLIEEGFLALNLIVAQPIDNVSLTLFGLLLVCAYNLLSQVIGYQIIGGSKLQGLHTQSAVFVLQCLNDSGTSISTQLLQVVVCLSVGSSTSVLAELDGFLIASQQTDLRLDELTYILVWSLGSSSLKSVKNSFLILGISGSRSKVGYTIDGILQQVVLSLLCGLHHTNQDFN